MTENLSEYFSLVFTREYISSLPVPETKFKGESSRETTGTNCNHNNGS